MPIAPQGRGAITTPDDTILEGWQIVVEIATGWQKGDQLVFMTSVCSLLFFFFWLEFIIILCKIK